MNYRHLPGLLLLSALIFGCGGSTTLIISDQAFTQLAGEKLSRRLGGNTRFETFSAPPAAEIVAAAAGDRGADALVFSPLFYRLAAEVAPLLPDTGVYAVVPPGAAESEGVTSVTVDMVEAADLILREIESVDSVLMFYRADLPAWRDLALKLEEEGAGRGPGSVTVPFRAGDDPASLVAGVAGEEYSVILLLGGSKSADLNRILSDRYPEAFYISETFPPAGKDLHGVILELDWIQLYAGLFAGESSSGSWTLSPF